MAIFDRIRIRVVATGAGLCSIAFALTPGVALAGGSECLEASAGDPAAAAACAPITGMAGVPMALPGPALAPVVPVAPPVPVVPLVPPVPPLAPPVVPLAPPAPVAQALPLVPPVLAGAPGGGLPLATMGGLAGKGDLTGSAPSGAPVSGQPILPGPGA